VLKRRNNRSTIVGTVVAIAVLAVAGCAGGSGAGTAHVAKPPAQGSAGATTAGRTAQAATSCVRSVVAAGDMLTLADARATGRLAVRLNPNLVLALGDEQYPTGSLAGFRNDYAKTGWGRLKARTRPVPGNHEYGTPGAAGYFTYFNHPPRYYAYNVGCGWRAYALNSEVNLAKEAIWLRRDLAAHPRAPALAYWHRPFLSSGVVHGGDPHLVYLWRPFLGRKTIVLNGHEHNYERFAPRHRIREFVVGTGGSASYPFRANKARGSTRRIAHTPGLLRVHLKTGSYTWSFRTTSNRLIDTGHG
jgi:hypothetical protein